MKEIYVMDTVMTVSAFFALVTGMIFIMTEWYSKHKELHTFRVILLLIITASLTCYFSYGNMKSMLAEKLGFFDYIKDHYEEIDTTLKRNPTDLEIYEEGLENKPKKP